MFNFYFWVKFAITAFDNIRVLIFKTKPLRTPVFVSFNLTYSCNASCSGCNTHGLSNKNKSQPKLMLSETKQLLQNLWNSGSCILTLTGGEFFVYKDGMELLNFCLDIGFKVNVNSNGLLLPKYLKELPNNSNFSLTISLDYLSNHDYQETGKGKNVFSALDNVFQSLKNIKNRKFKVISKITVNSRNVSHLNEILDYAEQKTDHIRIQPFHQNSDLLDSINFNTNTQMGQLNEEQIQSLKNTLSNHKSLQKLLPNKYLNKMHLFFKNFGNIRKSFLCRSGVLNLKFDPYGNVFNCSSMVLLLGNTKVASFDEIFHSPEYQKLRKNGIRNCFCYTADNSYNIYLNSF